MPLSQPDVMEYGQICLSLFHFSCSFSSVFIVSREGLEAAVLTFRWTPKYFQKTQDREVQVGHENESDLVSTRFQNSTSCVLFFFFVWLNAVGLGIFLGLTGTNFIRLCLSNRDTTGSKPQ